MFGKEGVFFWPLFCCLAMNITTDLINVVQIFIGTGLGPQNSSFHFDKDLDKDTF